MREPDLHYETQIAMDIEDATKNLAENLHLKWNYGLLFVDKYSTERGLPVSVISGIRKFDDTQYHLRIHLTGEQTGVIARMDFWRVITSGWPFPAGLMNLSTGNNDKLVDLVDEILEFCATPYENTGGVFTWLKNTFGGNLETRKYKN